MARPQLGVAPSRSSDAARLTDIGGGAWTSFTPSFAATGGTGVSFSNLAGAYRIEGKKLMFRASGQTTATASPSGLTMTLPGSSTAQGTSSVSANQIGGGAFGAYVQSTTVTVTGTLGTNNFFAIGGTIEVQ